jgi:hypothetical protein
MLSPLHLLYIDAGFHLRGYLVLEVVEFLHFVLGLRQRFPECWQR